VGEPAGTVVDLGCEFRGTYFPLLVPSSLSFSSSASSFIVENCREGFGKLHPPWATWAPLCR